MPVSAIPPALRQGLGRPDAKFPGVPPQATSAQLLQQLTNSWGLVGTMVSRAEAAWILELAAHPNADQALMDAIASRCATVSIGSSADQLGFDDWLTTLRAGGAAPAPSTPTASGALTGKLIAQDATKVATTASHDILFASNQGGQWMPDLQLRRRDITDPQPKDVIAQPTPAELSAVTTAAGFKALLDKLLADNKAYLLPDRATLVATLPEADRSNYAFLNLTGRRIEQFFNEMQRIVGRTPLAGTEAKEARKQLNLAYRDQFRGRTAEFDRANTGTYWSYGHDAAFVHVFEKMLESFPDNDPKKKPIQAQIDFILTNKFAPHGHVIEDDIEGNLGLVAIEKATRAVVSMTPDSDGSNNVRYETLKAGDRQAYRDGSQYFWQGGRTQLTDAEVQTLRRTPVDTTAIVLRRPLAGEQTRNAFRYDWDGNRMINANRVDTGWWGHCDIKALIETLLADMAKSGGVTEFRSDTKRTTEFSREMQLEGLAALLNFDDAYVNQFGGGAMSFGQTNFAGGRNDDRPTQLSLTTDSGRSLNLPIRLTELSDKADPTQMVDVEKAFNPKLSDANNESFTNNADVRIDPNTRDTAVMTVTGRKLIGTTDGYTFDSSGRPIEAKVAFELDPKATTGDKILLGTELKDINGRALDRLYYDPTTQTVSRVATTFVQENGSYVAKEGASQAMGKLRDMTLGKELKAGDDVQGKLAMLEEAVRTGRKIATDSDTGMQVWNGEVHNIRRSIEWRSADGLWERESVTIDATFGSGKVGTFLHKLDDEGRIVESMEIRAAVDFYWADNPRIAPLINERGNWYVNRSMLERGVVDMGAGKAASIGAMQDLADLIYLGLSAKNNAKLFTIVHEGKRYMYEDEAAWRADMDKLSGAGGTGGTGGGTGGTPTLITQARQPNLSVPDNDPNGASDTMTVDRDGVIKGIKLDIDLRHTYVGDLDVMLIAPDGTQVKLHARGGRDSDDLVGTYGDALRSHEDLAGLVGKQAKGDWKLKIVDLAGQDVGNLVSWGLKIDV